jgi:hypothetical protein
VESITMDRDRHKSVNPAHRFPISEPHSVLLENLPIA